VSYFEPLGPRVLETNNRSLAQQEKPIPALKE
jgi:hypothetical protein